MQLTVAATVTVDDGARLAVADGGGLERRDRPLAVLQHGFPDTPATWRHLAPAMVAQGWRVATPWLRGYGPSRSGAARTTIQRYAADLSAVHRACGGDGRAIVVGHDWGAAAAWRSAGGTQGAWAAVVGLALPPEPALAGFLLRPDQLWRSRYQLQAQLPVAGWVRRRRLAPLLGLWRRWSPGYALTDDDVSPLRAALGTRRQVAAALAPYRDQLLEGLLGRVPDPTAPLPAVPSLVLHGGDDGCIHPRYARVAGELDLPEGSRVHVVDGAGHFLHLERPDVVAEQITGFLDHVGPRG